MTKVHRNKPKGQWVPIKPERLLRNTTRQQPGGPQETGSRTESSSCRPATRPEGVTFELMEGDAVCKHCKGRRGDCWRVGSARRGRGRPAKRPVVIGAMTYGRCTSCRAANVPCTLDAPSKAAPTQAVQHRNKNESNHPATGPSAPRSAAASAIVPPPSHPEPERSPYGTHLLFKDVTSSVYHAAGILEDSIQNLRESVEELQNSIPSVELPGDLSPTSRVVVAEDKHYALINHYTSPSIQEAITVSNTSIDHLEEVVDHLFATLSGLPTPDSNSEDSDMLDD
ncbi:hypothetical protein FA13DRAFT_1712081 [Coprinellus micaceus]|uniref:Uncharacterized protein n=1 Tax=Coprinellus micaceus TaxID=71717 RepID=A0A4Y7T1J5_COPMI|nr:hypothetical protein FA13DRAFT_1712081 [Coprinellus micaceus]